MTLLIAALPLSVALVASTVLTDRTPPADQLKNIDDGTGKPKALIRLTEPNGALQGKNEKIFVLPCYRRAGSNERANPGSSKYDNSRRL